MKKELWREVGRKIMESAQSLYISLFSEEKSDVLKEVSTAIMLLFLSDDCYGNYLILY